MKNIAVLTSGGDSPGMNSAIRAVARTCAHYDIKCTGIIRGYSGLIENDTKNLYTRSVRGIINRGGMDFIEKAVKSHQSGNIWMNLD